MIEYGPILERLTSDLYNVASVGVGEYQLGRISDFIPSETINSIVPVIKTISFIATIIMALAIIIIKKKGMTPAKPKEAAVNLIIEETSSLPITQKASPGAMTARWEEILRHLTTNVEAQWRFALIEADKLVEDILRRAGFPGDTMGERLMNIQSGQLQTIDGLWEAHKLRNRIAHDLNYFLRYTEAKRAIGQFEATLRELSAL
ncbi:MAG: hypothetical protein AAB561_01770 [Patescibacteria group bacterium]